MIVRSLIVTVALLVLAAGSAFADDEPPAPQPPKEEPDRPRAPDPAQRAVLPALHAADADRDGAVTAEEWAAHLEMLAEAFSKLDKNSDGALRGDEMPRRPRRRGPRRARGPDMRGPPGAPRPPTHRAHAGPGGPPPPPQPPHWQPPGRRGPHGPEGRPPPRAGGPDRPKPPAGRDGSPPRDRPGRNVPGRRPPGAPPAGAGLEARLDRLIQALERLLETSGEKKAAK